MERPSGYGWFHFMMVGITLAILIAYIALFKKASEKTYRRIIFCTWVAMVILELLKQLTLNFRYNEADPSLSTFDYFWDGFPFQFCAVPLYAYPFIVFLPNKGKVSKFFWESFVGLAVCFAPIGGFASLIYPEQLFTSLIIINIQSLLYHGLMIVVGIYTAVWLGERCNLKFVSKSPISFLFFVSMAMFLNILFVKGGILAEGTVFNMFYISPYFPCTLPILSEIYPLIPYIVFLLLYVLGFILLAFIYYEIVYWICYLVRKLESKKPAEIVVQEQ